MLPSYSHEYVGHFGLFLYNSSSLNPVQHHHFKLYCFVCSLSLRLSTDANLFRTSFEAAQKVASAMEDSGEVEEKSEEEAPETEKSEAKLEDAVTSEGTTNLENLKVKEEEAPAAASGEAEATSSDKPAEESTAPVKAKEES